MELRDSDDMDSDDKGKNMDSDDKGKKQSRIVEPLSGSKHSIYLRTFTPLSNSVRYINPI